MNRTDIDEVIRVVRATEQARIVEKLKAAATRLDIGSALRTIIVEETPPGPVGGLRWCGHEVQAKRANGGPNG
jgi:hypothetical protein